MKLYHLKELSLVQGKFSIGDVCLLAVLGEENRSTAVSVFVREIKEVKWQYSSCAWLVSIT